ncbi:SDR family oxidoreductase [Turneriella parva]|uniref:3-dehydrosphinganine reductase n=1 Tax=Turneriella parva (strain ATCC BAA-1111 / DSM 21527 / NCTC 11395 / H) TaxID=869212 RepID=I4B8J7_TURPD|nr:SDR family oxidoreductase [Turneriella parva]AFM13604.1 short-chain dehydrogenase/reductase SDR [Turneriella parva DSM 21527]
MKHRLGGVYAITGASKGIGRAFAHALAPKASALVLLARDAKALKAVSAELTKLNPKLSVETYSVDLSDPKAIKKTTDAIRKAHRTINGIVNNAGYARPGYFHELPADEFEKAMRVDYLGAVHVTRALHDLVPKGGLITFTSSVVGYMGVFGYSSYAGAKFALIGFAETLRQELAAREIQVSVLCPPDTETPGYAIENQTKPVETQALSAGAKLMTAEAVAQKFVNGIERGKFLINCNFDSALIYRLKSIWPSLVHRIMLGMIKKAQKKKLS